MKPYVAAFIFARGGSKGLPRKNLRALAGRPLVAWAIETARSSSMIQRVIVSTDDAEIAEVSRRYGAEVPFLRPAALAADDSPEWLAWQHALRAVAAAGGPRVDVFVAVPPTAPLRSVADVDACIRTLVETDADLVLTIQPAQHNLCLRLQRARLAPACEAGG